MMADPDPRSPFSSAMARAALRVGGLAALVAAIAFRRNLAAEVSLMAELTPPGTAHGWVHLMNTNGLMGCLLLNGFDLINYALLALLFIGLFTALWRAQPRLVSLALALGLVGALAFFASSRAVHMLLLSQRYGAASDAAQRGMILAEVEALPGLFPDAAGAIRLSAGEDLGLGLVSLSGLLFALAMLRSALFGKWAARFGLLGNALILGYFLTLALAPELIALPHVLGAGPLVVWQFLSGRRLIRLARGASALPVASALRQA